ncbi:cytochrome c oxidase assembly factor 3 homolog, mitochondrial [Gopherus flavomarginatus]|uniref:cytochrome c oxidase assembly factor 3 homolog, mitochondrial n=1 Tax=Gopherus flavomarginatus TaxID=286002 RepID=UPI0021CC2C99|nr:cytochrome c oxidase assembly factor 3 homolog, mitochondrial [Gopherus flavomarginatus]
MTIASALRPFSHVGAGRGSAGKMAAPREPGRDSEAAFAKRIDPAREPELSAEQRRVTQRAEEALRRRLRGRNLLTGLGIGAVVLGIYGFTFYKISQERFLDELEQEVEAARAQAAKTPVN